MVIDGNNEQKIAIITAKDRAGVAVSRAIDAIFERIEIVCHIRTDKTCVADIVVVPMAEDAIGA